MQDLIDKSVDNIINVYIDLEIFPLKIRSQKYGDSKIEGVKLADSIE